jgi:hypothetical protein
MQTDVFAIFGTNLENFERIFFGRYDGYLPFDLLAGKTAQPDLAGSNGYKFLNIPEN